MIEAYYPGRSRPTIITGETRAPFTGGGAANKDLVTGEVGNRTVSLIERRYDPRFVANWQLLKDAGLPVLPTLRTTDQDTMLMTDLKADGSELYGAGLHYLLHYTTEQRRLPAPGVDKHFIDLMDNHRGEIETAIGDLVSTANEQRISLPTDDPAELHVHPDNTWEFIVLDAQSVFTGEGVISLNERNGQLLLRDLLNIRAKLAPAKE